MMLIKKVPGFDGWHPGETRDYGHLIGLLPPANCTLHEIGKSTDEDYDIYAISHGDLNAGNTLWLTGGMHGGTEWMSCYYALEFVTALANPEGRPQEYYLKWVMSQFDAVYLVVCANPWGFVNGTRNNKNDVDLNRNFDSVSPETETTVIKNNIDEIKPRIVLDCHEKVSSGVALASVDNWRGPVDDDYYPEETWRAIRYAKHLAGEPANYHGTNASSGELRRWAATEAENADGGQIWAFIIEPGDSSTTDSDAELRTKRGINITFAVTLALKGVGKAYTPRLKKGSELAPIVAQDKQLNPLLVGSV